MPITLTSISNKAALLWLVLGLALLRVGYLVPSWHDHTPKCYGEADIQSIQSIFLADQQAAKTRHVGNRLCLDGIVAFVQLGPEQVTGAINIADQVSADLSRTEGQQKYQEILEWAEEHGKGENIRFKCGLRRFALVEGAPEPMAIPEFGSCSPAW